MTRKSIYVYSAFLTATVVLMFSQNVFYFIYLTYASVNLHRSIFKKVVNATMNFYSINPIGRILNRFSKDMGIVDEYIPVILVEVIQTGSTLIASVIFSSIVDYWLLVYFAFLFILYYTSRLFYISTSQAAKRVEAITRNPIFNQIAASIDGLTTIRVSEAQNRLLEEFDAHQDIHSTAWDLFISASRAFSLWLDTLSIIFITVVVLYFLGSNHGYSGAQVGFLITNYVSLGTVISLGMRLICEFETNMVSVERVLEYTDIETEPHKNTTQNLPVNWPELGKIELKNVSLKYTSNETPVLKNINLTIYPREKIGVVGRTGAGKSSLLIALFQMYDTEGFILVDNVDVTKIPLKSLRSKISTIPQEPVLFYGTLRKNLDPLEEYEDKLLWDALEQVELKQLIASSVGGLSTKVQEGGSNFSIGEKQLICFARAIIRNNKILIMDEATANVDPYTDAIIQRTIRKIFSECTVITIAHRIDTIIDCDKILVMDNGCAVEYDHPSNLLKAQNSLFHEMAQALGDDVLRQLQQKAKVQTLC